MPPIRRRFLPRALLWTAALPFLSHAADEAAQIGSPVVWTPLDAPGTATHPTRYYALQAAKAGRLVLTASNGFFTRGLRASGDYPFADRATHNFNPADFATLSGWTETGREARWHVLIKTAGELVVGPGPAIGGGGDFIVAVAGESRPLVYREGRCVPAVFPRVPAGAAILTVRAASPSSAAKLGDLTLSGAAIRDAGLLRARWRPAAAHNRYDASGLAAPDLWVMSTRSVSPVSSYSPIVTPFGYYGTTFDAGGVCGGGINFSLWGAGAGEPQERWSHLLAVGSPDAAFGSFGHEGNGVKIRDARPLAGVREVTLALRREPTPPFDTYYAYYFDAQADRWRLYGVGRSLQKRGKPGGMTPRDFVEQPGPPAVERSGDVIRDIRRRGWVARNDGPWVPLDSVRSGDGRRDYANRYGEATPDGGFRTGMGGMIHYAYGKNTVVTSTPPATLPAFLSDAHRAELAALPATWGPRAFTGIAADTATLRVTIPKAGANARVTVFYDTADRTTFATMPVFRDVVARVWSCRLPAAPVKDGDTMFTLSGLSPGTRYYVRLLLENDAGKIWTFETDTFVTAK